MKIKVIRDCERVYTLTGEVDTIMFVQETDGWWHVFIDGKRELLGGSEGISDLVEALERVPVQPHPHPYLAAAEKLSELIPLLDEARYASAKAVADLPTPPPAPPSHEKEYLQGLEEGKNANEDIPF